jgi:hypothetical protein
VPEQAEQRLQQHRWQVEGFLSTLIPRGVLRVRRHLAGWLAVLGSALVVGCEKRAGAESRADEHPLRVASTTALPIEFGGVAGAVRLSSGQVVVADYGRAHLRVFSTTNDTGAVLGRRGSGPGEFDWLYRLHACSDSLFAYDFTASRLQIFTSSRFVRQVQLPATLAGADFAGCGGADSLYFVKMPNQVPGKGNQLFPLTVFRLSGQTNDLQWVTSLRGTEMFVSEQHSAFFERPFADRTLIVAGPGGPVINEWPSSTVRRLDAGGAEHAMTLRGRRPRSVTDADRTRYLDARLAAEPDSTMRRLIRAVHAEMEWGDRVPIIDALVVASGGGVIARLSPGSRDSVAAWLRIREGEALMGRLTLPIGDRVLFADDRTVLVLRSRPTGEEDVLILEVEERSSTHLSRAASAAWSDVVTGRARAAGGGVVAAGETRAARS